MENVNFHQTLNEIPETLRLPLTIWYKCGFLSTNKFKKYFLLTLLALVLANVIVIGMVQFINMEKNIADFVKNLEEVSGYSQLLGKVLVVTYQGDTFVRLIHITKLFWNLNKCSQQTVEKVLEIYRLNYRLIKAFALFLSLGVILFMMHPLLENAPPAGIWTLEGHDKLYYFSMIEQVLIIPCSGVFVWSIDTMYLGFCTEIIVQFKILCQYLDDLKAEGNSIDEMEKNCLDKMKTCIQHHELMLGFIKEFRRAFSLTLLIQYLSVCPLSCAELFAVFESRYYPNKARHAFIFLAGILQLSFYCVTANYVADEALSVSNAVYSSKWYLHSFPSLKVPLLVMMQSAQNGITIRAGGLVDINAETFVRLLKVAWSACSLARGLRQN